jgi:glutathione S-transferase
MPRLSLSHGILIALVSIILGHYLPLVLTFVHQQSSSTMSGSPPYHNLTYYTFGTPNGLKPAIVLEELGLQYKVEKVDITTNAQKQPSYLEINPNGRIPALKDGDLRVFETGAIMLYLTDHYDKEQKLNYPAGSREYYEVLSWLMWQMGGLGPMQVSVFHTPSRFQSPSYN